MLQQCLDFGGDIEIANYSNTHCNQMTSNAQHQRLFLEQKMTFTEQVCGGDVEIALSWKNRNDLDLHCECRCGFDISYMSYLVVFPSSDFFRNKTCYTCNGFLDIDMNPSLANASNTPVEHIYWANCVPGDYKVRVHFFRNHDGIERETEYLLLVKVKGDVVFDKMGTMTKPSAFDNVLTFSFDDKETFSILKAGK